MGRPPPLILGDRHPVFPKSSPLEVINCQDRAWLCMPHLITLCLPNSVSLCLSLHLPVSPPYRCTSLCLCISSRLSAYLSLSPCLCPCRSVCGLSPSLSRIHSFLLAFHGRRVICLILQLLPRSTAEFDGRVRRMIGKQDSPDDLIAKRVSGTQPIIEEYYVSGL